MSRLRALIGTFPFLFFIEQGCDGLRILAGIPSLVLSFIIFFIYLFISFLFLQIYLTTKLCEERVYENQHDGLFDSLSLSTSLRVSVLPFRAHLHAQRDGYIIQKSIIPPSITYIFL